MAGRWKGGTLNTHAPVLRNFPKFFLEEESLYVLDKRLVMCEI
jgi:hypothetical protein